MSVITSAELPHQFRNRGPGRVGGPGAPLPGLPGDDWRWLAAGGQVVGGAGQPPAPPSLGRIVHPRLAQLCCLGLALRAAALFGLNTDEKAVA